MKNYAIKINGSGTAEEIAKALKSVITSIECDLGEDPVQWEDQTLMTEIYLSDNDRYDEAALEEARDILCDNDDLEGDSILEQVKLIAKHAETNPDDYIDDVDEVIVWEKLTNYYTCQEFLDEIGWTN